MIAGLRLSPLRVIPGEAGAVLHAVKKSAETFAGFGEAYFSEIRQGAIKSWRRHLRATSNLVVPQGAVRFVVHDGLEFSECSIGRAADYALLTLSPGLWFAFQGLGPGTSLILSVSSLEHDPAESETRPLGDFPYSW